MFQKIPEKFKVKVNLKEVLLHKKMRFPMKDFSVQCQSYCVDREFIIYNLSSIKKLSNITNVQI